ncbi:MAG TPA: sigma-70 family RNA polymerase sigma factor [Gemmataceae bacterium]|jgi:RNA polymerase sigma-70 factor (ECF subfamily)|nr:sigma-70 family RNA polymerase sigma factor [Gemmataceae bacterium]
MTLAADPEIELMLRVQQDEAGAFAVLIAAYWSRVFGRFVRQFGDRQEAEDLAQDVFLRLYRSRKSYRPTAKLSTWIFFISRNVGRNGLRRRRRKRLLPIGLANDGEDLHAFGVDGDAATPALSLERLELVNLVRGAVALLNRRQRRAVELQFENRSYAEIAQALDMSPKAAKSLLYRARNELRSALLPRVPVGSD